MVDNSQGLEMARSATNILGSALDAFAGIIANNQNEVLQYIILCAYAAGMVTSIYGMNVPILTHITFRHPGILSLLISLAIGWFFLHALVSQVHKSL